MNRQKTPIALAGFTAAVLLAACGGGGGGGSTDSTAGTLKVSLTDAPACGFDNVFVTVSKVRVHKSDDAAETDGGWSEIVLATPRKIDLLSLVNGKLDDLGQTTLPVGTYNQMRLVLVPNTGGTMANSVVPSNGTERPLDTPSGVQSGIKLNGTFEVKEGATTEIALDFDACKSIVSRGNGSFGLKPVIRMIPVAVSGAINGYVDKTVVGAVVSAQANGVVLRSTAPDANGYFSLAPLEAGSYAVVITGGSRSTEVVGAVPVTASGATALSTSAQPLLTTVSTFGMVKGSLLPAQAEATASAYQALSGGPTVEVAYRAADSEGRYELSLPLAAPRYGQYSATLPISFTTQGPLAGKYAVRATAAGYQSQTIDIDLGAIDLTRDITLVR